MSRTTCVGPWPGVATWASISRTTRAAMVSTGCRTVDSLGSVYWDSGANQQWTVEPDGTLQVYGKCMDITGANYGNGTLIELWTCNGGSNQQWHLP